MAFKISHGAVIGTALLLPLTHSADAQADSKECAGAYEKSQELKSQSKLRAAREALLTCAQAACPDFIKRDCGKWLGEVDSQLPTVVFSAKAKGEEISDVRVLIGEEVIAESLDGRSLPMDPGGRVFTFESEEHGTKEVRFTVKEGQKAQNVVADYGGEAPSGGGGGGSVSTDDASDKTLAYVFTGVGAVGLGAFAFFALTGKSDEDGLACADTKTCTDDDIDPIKQKYLFADIGLGVGVVSLGLATYFFLKPSGGGGDAAAEDSARRVRVDVLPTRGGGFASVSGHF